MRGEKEVKVMRMCDRMIDYGTRSNVLRSRSHSTREILLEETRVMTFLHDDERYVRFIRAVDLRLLARRLDGAQLTTEYLQYAEDTTLHVQYLIELSIADTIAIVNDVMWFPRAKMRG